MKILNDLIKHLIYQAINLAGMIIGVIDVWNAAPPDGMPSVMDVIPGVLLIIISFIAFYHRHKLH